MATPPLDIPFQAPNLLPTLEQTHVVLEVTPNDDPRRAYNLAIPKEWGYSAEFGPVAHGLLQAQGIGFFAGSMDTHAPVIAVTSTQVPFEVPVDAWARQTVRVEGWQLVHGQWFPGSNGLFYDVTAERVINEVHEVRRSSLRNLGSEIVAVNCFCAREWWEGAKEIFWLAHATFELQAKPQSRMEVWAEAQATRAPGFALNYPLSWTEEEAEGPDPGISGIHLRLTDAKVEKLLAYVQVKVVKRAPGTNADLEKLQTAALAQLARAGVSVTAAPSLLSEQEDPRAIAVKGWLAGLQATGQLGTSDVALRIGFIDRDGHDAYFVMIGPLLHDDTLTALRAQRAFEIARATFTLVPTSGAATGL